MYDTFVLFTMYVCIRTCLDHVALCIRARSYTLKHCCVLERMPILQLSFTHLKKSRTQCKTTPSIPADHTMHDVVASLPPTRTLREDLPFATAPFPLSHAKNASDGRVVLGPTRLHYNLYITVIYHGTPDANACLLLHSFSGSTLPLLYLYPTLTSIDFSFQYRNSEFKFQSISNQHSHFHSHHFSYPSSSSSSSSPVFFQQKPFRVEMRCPGPGAITTVCWGCVCGIFRRNGWGFVLAGGGAVGCVWMMGMEGGRGCVMG